MIATTNTLELNEEVRNTLLSELKSGFENNFDEYEEGLQKEIEFSKNNLSFWVDGWFRNDSYELNSVYITDELTDTELEFVHSDSKYIGFAKEIQEAMRELALDLLANEPDKTDWKEENYLTHLRTAV